MQEDAVRLVDLIERAAARQDDQCDQELATRALRECFTDDELAHLGYLIAEILGGFFIRDKGSDAGYDD